MSEMSLEERALRHCDKFFSNERLWWHGSNKHPEMGAICVGLLLNRYRRDALDKGVLDDGGFQWASEVMGVPYVTQWNDALPSFKAMKSALKVRIKHYKGMRTGSWSSR